MSRETIYICDRCKKRSPEEVHSFDFGKDYSQSRNELQQIPRVIVDLCKECWIELKAWLKSV